MLRESVLVCHFLITIIIIILILKFPCRFFRNFLLFFFLPLRFMVKNYSHFFFFCFFFL